ncbi:MAG: dihydropteroate synthase [Bacteroidales bacterium]|nr:dihydropteroate synthase [Bacteroidales bacterium]
MHTDREIYIMGIVNMTDDSYFAQSRCGNAGAAVRRAGKLIEEGASIIDVGACSTRPGSAAVGAEEEWRRLEPALEAIRNAFPDVRISVDTYWAEIVARTYDLIGDFIVNDISSGEDDPEMLGTVGGLGLTYVAMHKKGTPMTMQSLCSYDDVTREVAQYFDDFAAKAAAAGIRDWIIDPGFGFAKDIGQNYELLGGLSSLKSMCGGRRVLVGVSRKSMIYRYFNISPEEALPATQVLHFKALQLGADILRVHDAAQAVQTVQLYRMLG